MTSRLAALLDQAAEISDWHRRGADFCSQSSEIERHERYADAVEELGEAARLLVDMAAFVRGDTPDDECDVPGCSDPWCCDHDAEALLARFAEIEAKAGHE